jgi:hypothetical protein
MSGQPIHRGQPQGSQHPLDLLFRFGPCLIIIDELVAYARNLYGVERLPGRFLRSIMSFMQALTEAVKGSPSLMLLISLPESDIESRRSGRQASPGDLAHIVGRIESVWKPVTATESFEIVRRRLFADEIDHAAGTPPWAPLPTCTATSRASSRRAWPRGTTWTRHARRLSHPPGALRPPLPGLVDAGPLPAHPRRAASHGCRHPPLCGPEATSPLLILPGTLPLDATPVRNELLRYLPDTWTAVFDVDIDGAESRP